MSAGPRQRLPDMTESTTTSTTVSNLAVAMFTVSDQDAALAFYRDKLGYEVRGDMRFGENGENRWLEVAPPGSAARLALNPPMNGTPGGGSIGVETPDVLGEYSRLRALGGGGPPAPPVGLRGAPLMFAPAHPPREPNCGAA